MKKKKKYFCVFQIVKREKNAKAKREIFLLFSILEGSNLKRKRERPNKKQKKIFLVFLIIRKKRKQRENLFGFSNSKQKEQQKQLNKIKRTKRKLTNIQRNNEHTDI